MRSFAHNLIRRSSPWPGSSEYSVESPGFGRKNSFPAVTLPALSSDLQTLETIDFICTCALCLEATSSRGAVAGCQRDNQGNAEESEVGIRTAIRNELRKIHSIRTLGKVTILSP